jgi:hypothetical protein
LHGIISPAACILKGIESKYETEQVEHVFYYIVPVLQFGKNEWVTLDDSDICLEKLAQ